jgi:hypothetical protein
MQKVPWQRKSSLICDSRIVSKTVLRNEYSRCFYLYFLSQNVSAYLMAILRRILQNNKISCYFYNGYVVFSAIMCVEIENSFNILYDSPEDGHQIGRNMLR